MSVLHAAVPFFLGLIALEWLVARRRGRRVYALHDSVMDIGCGILSQIVGVFIAVLGIGSYQLVADLAVVQYHLALPWPKGGPLSSMGGAAAWLSVFVVVDFGQYWIHRASHRVSLLWACHLVHHSSEQLNYTVALRNSSLHGLFLWVFPLPLAIAGVPWQTFAICYGLNVAYQFWLHTRVIGRLGPLEAIFNTPSHHRVHHGRDAEYVDRNFAGVLIVWDRLFGTFTRETREPEYGIAQRVPGSDPVATNLWGFAAIGREMGRAAGLRGKLRAVLGPPQWRELPRDPVGGADADGDGDWGLLAHALVQFLALLIATIVLLPELGIGSLREVAGFGVLAALLLTGVGAALDGKWWAPRFEALRLFSVGLACLVPAIRDSVPIPSRLVLLYAALSLAGLGIAAIGRRAGIGGVMNDRRVADARTTTDTRTARPPPVQIKAFEDTWHWDQAVKWGVSPRRRDFI
jgi:sterol desaturase/sphingolipid hydroxylase (fatty acid hydroxylase superfamily)